MRNEVCQQKLVKFVLNGLFRFPMYDTSKFAVLSYSCPIIVTKAIIITMLFILKNYGRETKVVIEEEKLIRVISRN
jgi:hypothetical protein